MTGSLQVKNDTYYAVLNLTMKNGKHTKKWFSSKLSTKGNNKRKAEKFLQQKIKEYEDLFTLDATTIPFSNIVREWLKAAEKTVDAVTYQGYENVANSHVLPYFDESGLYLNQITRSCLQKFLDEKSENGRLDGKGGLAPATVRQVKNILHQSLSEAMKNDLIAINPCASVDLPKSQRYQADYYNEEELKTFLACIQDEMLFPLIYTTTLLGLRRSEVLGLQWDSIDWAANTITIKHTVCRMKTIVEKDKTKNATSYRSFPMTDEMRTMFAKLKTEEEANRRLFGREYHQNDYIFKWTDGRTFTPDYVGHAWPKILKRHNLRHIRYHDLRHSCASLLIMNGYSLKDVQEWLGHANITMTANVYGHIDASRKENMANKVQSLFSK